MNAMTTHIRQKAARGKRGSGFYLDRSSDDPQRRTMCGAKPTDLDMSWAETRWAKNMAWVSCPECKAARDVEAAA